MKSTVIQFKNSPSFLSFAVVGGEKEREGPLGGRFDHIDITNTFGMDTWEQAENESQRLAMNFALKKAGLCPDLIDGIFAGDLINQCTGSAFGLLSFNSPYFGVYGACSTSALTITLSSIAISSGVYEKCAAVCSSHFCSAERQFRFPLEYGALRSPTSQWTVTAGAAFILGMGGDGPFIHSACPGRTVDGGIDDANNMGAAMAPAAIDTLKRYFEATNTRPEDYDGIFTGDLGYEGYSIVKDLMKDEGYDMGDNYRDCGLIIYDRTAQKMNAGGSGCGCSASVLATFILPEIINGGMKDVLFVATGALMSPMTLQQGLTIPSVAHLIRIKGKG